MFTDELSGKNRNRPQLKAMISYVRDGDTVTVHSLDRLGRSLDDLRALVRELTGKGVKVEFLKENLTFSGDDSPMANLLLSVMGAFAEFERELILKRQREGIAVAKKAGKYKGRKPSLTDEQAEQLRARTEAGESKAALAREFGISRETAYAYIRSRTAEASGEGTLNTKVSVARPPE